MIRLYSIPTMALGFVIVGLTVGVSLLLLVASRRLLRWLPHPGNDVVCSVLGATTMIYALLLGLLAVASWDSLKSVKEAATKEALQAGKLYWDLSGYAPGDRDHLRSMIREYLRTVIEVEWPQQQRGIVLREPKILVDLVEDWTRVEPATDGRKLIHAEALSELNEMLASGRIRRQANDQALPMALWDVVLAGGVLNIALASLIRTETPRTMMVLIAALAVMIGLMIFEIVAVDRPLWGEVSIQSAPYSEVLKSLAQ
jgi:hypothetical protein